ncbi:hypothetical protein GCM10023340_11440 [Nocardioides marinquilinus]|uniref:Uncharacterized protein n=1 Tax=Nocardioides marinquilinus TaxID=1210400 RepID=A0ABP9PC01_9ACTN
MNTNLKRTITALAGTAAVLTTIAGPGSATQPVAAPDDARGVLVQPDKKGEVKPGALDIQRVKVTHTADRLTVRVVLPGVKEAGAYPLGWIQTYVDTDSTRKGPEYVHDMNFYGDYEFGEAENWKPASTKKWDHSPDGRCVATTSLRPDATGHLRFFEYTVEKREGCFFTTDAVRVAVTAQNDGVHDPYKVYKTPRTDHLGAKHTWTPWVGPAAS